MNNPFPALNSCPVGCLRLLLFIIIFHRLPYLLPILSLSVCLSPTHSLRRHVTSLPFKLAPGQLVFGFSLSRALSLSLSSSLLQTEKENPYEDVDPVRRCLARNSRLLPERSRDSLNRMWTSQDRKSVTSPQVVSLAV